MASLYFICPKTRRRGPTGIETDLPTLQKSWSERLNINCQHCGEVHETSVRELYVDTALDDYMLATSKGA
jgi:hypothetical protein